MEASHGGQLGPRARRDRRVLRRPRHRGHVTGVRPTRGPEPGLIAGRTGHRDLRRRAARRRSSPTPRRVRPDPPARVDHVPVRHADDRPDPDRDRDQHHPRPDRLGRPEGAVYLDSIGTILVGVLAGPIAGALTGGLANLIWTYVLPAPFHSDYAAPFFIVAVEIGLLAGVFGRLGFFRSRPNTPTDRLAIGGVVVVVIVAVIGDLRVPAVLHATAHCTFFAPPAEGATAPTRSS